MLKRVMRAVIVDDEPKNIKILKRLLVEFCRNVSVEGEATHSEEARQVIQDVKPDLVFLDIEIPFGNAFDLLDSLKPVNFEVIFITAFDEYSLKAFKYSALDYLLKPVNIEELVEAVAKVEKRLEHKLSHAQPENPSGRSSGQPAKSQRITLTDKDGGIVFLEIRDILRVEARRGYSFVFDKKGKSYISSRTIKEYEELLPADIFFRIHNSYIINVLRIKKYHKGRGGVVEMDDGVSIEVAARRRDEFLKRLDL